MKAENQYVYFSPYCVYQVLLVSSVLQCIRIVPHFVPWMCPLRLSILYDEKCSSSKSKYWKYPQSDSKYKI